MTNDKFRRALDMDFGDLDVKSKQELGVLMQRRKYLTGSDENKRQNQLVGAWEHLISVWGKQDVEYVRVKPIRWERIGNREVNRDSITGRFIKWR